MEQNLKPRNRILLHAIYWISVILFFSLFWGIRFGNFWHCLYNEILFLPVKFLVVYFVIYFLTPKFLYKKEYLYFGLTTISILILAGCIQQYIALFSFIPNHKALLDPAEVLYRIVDINTVMVIPFTLKLYDYSLSKEKRILILSQEKTQAELQFLRTQVQPHFLFNVLNNIYGLALLKSDKTPDMILKLTDLMRYMLHDSCAERVSVVKEIDYIRNFIDLEKLRYGNRFTIDFKTSGNLVESHIAPLLLLPFIENAFKHSTTNQIGSSWIKIDINVSDKILKLSVANSFDPHDSKSTILSSGIGIKNIRQRLEILYPDRYSLDTNVEDGIYSTTLYITLEP